MNFSLVVCTYMRPMALQNLLNSVSKQTLYPNEIIIVDGSLDDSTSNIFKNSTIKNLRYKLVDSDNRGLTKQRNYSIKMIGAGIDVVCFLDDDIVLEKNYFQNLIDTYKTKTDALAVGGYIKNEVLWKKEKAPKSVNKFYFDGWMRTEPSRFKLRRKFNLLPDTPPGYLPTFAHGRSIGFLPPSGKIYQVEQIMGGVSSYKKEVFNHLSFSTYFEGYGLYEDTDFSLRIAKRGKLYVNTAAQLNHYHDIGGRPNKFKYGKMVVRNGWYVWRVKYHKPELKSRLKWHCTVFLLTVIRLSNSITSNQKKEALTESLGRIVGWLSLIINKPKIN
ncbi:glycosyltransferase family 2 protein [Algibacter amylolyticus]|uniref:Glycosyltransferase family 2 protein n=2 Tax=Algibacter amylolyticus TaxID=1608400 RepID=A0A5M7AZ42_9FLAO|nr:glycosyltransferase family A protein [Algibacter amylolyticus]KAA5822429.1 glycosyltransferase family 2 protein [Algibacter amylolyticus]MBB5269151.1 GT2 family glycosyltransferase [Algibacter amylolyticus]TSJ73579.1 glycosyltransferase family 2 protein [Algibacter amylolyticus]